MAIKKKAIILGLDGMRPDMLQEARAPRIKGLGDEGAFSWDALTESVTSSGSAWTSLLTGVHTARHRVFGCDSTWRDWGFESFFLRAKGCMPGIRTIAHCNWAPIIEEIFEREALDVGSVGSDAEVTARIAEDVRGGRGDLHFVQLDDVDAAGHAHGYDSPEYRMSIEVIDSQVGEILDAVKSRPAEEDWMVWVISDHGGRGRDHGRPSPEEMTIALVLSSARLKGRGRLNAPGGPVPRIVDTAPTVCAHMGIPGSAAWQGRSWTDGQLH